MQVKTGQNQNRTAALRFISNQTLNSRLCPCCVAGDTNRTRTGSGGSVGESRNFRINPEGSGGGFGSESSLLPDQEAAGLGRLPW